MDLAARIHELEQLVAQARGVPLSSSVMINRDEVLELIKGMQEALPEEIKQARWVVKDREELLAKARREAEEIVERGREEQARLVGEQEVVRESRREGERIVEEAREQARQMRMEAEDYVDAKLASFEITLNQAREHLERIGEQVGRTIEQVERGRQRLRGATMAGQLATEEAGDREAPEPGEEPAEAGEDGEPEEVLGAGEDEG